MRVWRGAGILWLGGATWDTGDDGWLGRCRWFVGTGTSNTGREAGPPDCDACGPPRTRCDGPDARRPLWHNKAPARRKRPEPRHTCKGPGLPPERQPYAAAPTMLLYP